ncbi:hypothetical protein [Microbacterium sp. RU33B]|uniref:hypothetical protein n=1 Tax=Microbacterium sp. RU33B TaxID=1907390 RepID=UPI00095C8CB6|nr:hypothetical protein [Microbacterium sp. RU33B]SIT74934.1 hypothetical protein SAMN05880545_1407 [Microbacterium sp. RU33B]
MSSEGDSAHILEVITGSRFADAVPGRVTIVRVPPPAGRRRYQECEIELLAEASGIAPRTVVMTVVFDSRRWPDAGRVLPARISVRHHDAVDVNWDALGG